MQLIQKFLKANRERTVAIDCFGDAMVDEYYNVQVNRVSPEFPMPIMRSFINTPSCSRPGGAANVAAQFKNFNVASLLHCFYDPCCSGVFEDHRVHRMCGTCFGNACLPIKRRYVVGNLQVIRHDIEQPRCGLSDATIDEYHRLYARELTRPTLVPGMKNRIEQLDVAILSDYDKGFFSRHSYLNLLTNVKTIVDPKKAPLSKWKGCTVFKPNAKEAEELSGYSDWQSQAKYFRQELECKAVVITNGGGGITGIDGDELFGYWPNPIDNIKSVVGAGDCFCAFFAMAIGHNFSIPEAAEIAWNAGAKYVQGGMNRPITPAELSPNGIVEPEDLEKRDYKLVFTNGCFDLLHEGHIKTLEFAKEKGNKLVVALNSDASIRRLKGEGRPVIPLEQRMLVMSKLKPVDFVVSFDEDTPLEVIKKIKPDVLVKGADYEVGNIVGADVVPQVFRAPIIQGLSSSNFINRS